MNRPFFLTMLVALLLSACRKEPQPLTKKLVEASFYANVMGTQDDYPTKVSFINGSKGATEYLWDFGNGITSNEESPIVSFYSSHDLKVKLIARNGSVVDTFVWPVLMPYRPMSVAIVYMIPKDKNFDPALYKALEQSALVLQEWFRQKTGGKTFRLSSPYVDTVHSAKDGSWFVGYHGLGSSGGNDFSYLTLNTNDELYNLLHKKINNSRQIVLVFLPAPINNVAGIATMGSAYPWRTAIVYNGPFQTLSSTFPEFGLRIAAHELGHTFGLGHNNNIHGIMKGGDESPPFPGDRLCQFPDCILLNNEIDVLRNSLYFF